MLNDKTRFFFGHAAIYTLSNFAVSIVPFLLLPILTRALDPSAYGVVAMFTLTVSFFSVGLGLNLHAAITVRYFDRLNIDIPKYVSTVLTILIASTIFMFILVINGGAIFSKITSVPKKWLYVAVFVAFLQFVVMVLLALWQASKKPISYGAFRITHAFLDAIASIFLVIGLALSWQGRLSGLLAAWLCAASIAVFFLVREGWVSSSIDHRYAKDALNYGVPLVPHAIGGLLLGMADRFMVTNILDVSSAGIYVVAAQVGLILGVVADSFNKAFSPWLMERLSNISYELKKKIMTLTYVYFLAVIALAALGSIIAPYVLPFIVGPHFQPATQLIAYILFGNAFTGMYYMVTNYIFYSRRTGLLSALTTSIGVLTVALSWLLILQYGLLGAAIGYMVGQASLFIGAWILSNYCVPMPWFSFLTPPKSPQ